jgi:4-hydroxybenzoate polyprenyltransferase
MRKREIETFAQGLMFKVGVFMGWSDISVDGKIPWKVLVPIYCGACLWTWTYET